MILGENCDVRIEGARVSVCAGGGVTEVWLMIGGSTPIPRGTIHQITKTKNRLWKTLKRNNSLLNGRGGKKVWEGSTPAIRGGGKSNTRGKHASWGVSWVLKIRRLVDGCKCSVGERRAREKTEMGKK